MTRQDALRAAVARLRAAGLDDIAADDARQLLEQASGLSRTTLIATMIDAQPADEAERFDALVARRERREPLSHILGSVGFWTLDLTVTSEVLTPRADTETIVEAALNAVADKAAPLRLLDIGTGSGAIALALLSELPKASAVATDISPDALKVAAANASRNGLAGHLELVETRWADGLEGPFDLVASNPPYIASAVIKTLDPEVKDFEPALALDGGVDGLDPYPHLFAEAKRLLAPRGTGVFEIGYDQGEAALALAADAGASARLVPDLAGRDRAVVFSFSR
ncbi:peptide chain release factor N(5)-glutamine methyltransferase [Maricaulaceae bacterium EIL42A08]|nr:peptide chain release factor N(5)-glutamine methyltransferase [Maricaulaceae bacterium EIL42A08]